MVSTSATAQQLDATLGPLVQLLQQELQAAGVATPQRASASASDFSRWYLEVVQLLEAQVAADDAHPPMSRTEVELMCRCALSAATLREALGVLCRFCQMLHPRAGYLALRENGETATVVLDSLRGRTTRMSSLVDVTGLFAFRQLLQWLVGGSLPLRQVGIGPISRDDVMPFLQLFEAPVLAGGDAFYLAYDRTQLERPVVRQAGEFARFFQLFPCAVFDASADDLAGQVSAMLSAALQQGAPLPGVRQVAAALEIPESTFRRRLAQLGASFRALRDGCLRSAAENSLARSDISIVELARRLGFSDASAFRRAFRGWTGMSPSQWRVAQGGQPADDAREGD